MEALHIEDFPETRDPIFVMAFSGWNDAAEAATAAARYLVEHLGGRRFAWFEAENYIQLSDVRPQIRLNDAGERELAWPMNEFYYCPCGGLAHDLIVGIGVEPHLSWKRFSREVLSLIRRSGARTTVTLGALLAGEMHTQPIRLVGLATRPELIQRVGVERSGYEGPTGIVGVIHTLLQDEGMSALSLWANVPHYIAALPNPKATLALLERFTRLSGIPVDFAEIEKSASDFESQVENIIAKDPKISEYISKMYSESSEGSEGEELEENSSGERIAEEIELFLRRRREGGEER